MKILGYLIILVGIVLLFLNLAPEAIKTKLDLPVLEKIINVSPNYITIIAVVIVVIGIFLVLKSPTGNRKAVEVPIYKGNKVVGYRRQK